MTLRPSKLILENGLTFKGCSPSWQSSSAQGEVVFTTGMTGYVEALTDPSYTGEILIFTYPLIGNYGVPEKSYWESDKIYPAGVVISEISTFESHHQSKHSILDWLKKENVPVITEIDTRELVKNIREEGALLGTITTESKIPKKMTHPHKQHLVSKVSIEKKRSYGKGSKRILLIDCGMKGNILKSLMNFPITIDHVPYNYSFDVEEYDGIVISNGPGDPNQCPETIQQLQKAIKKTKPIFGICLGCQLIALAAGAKTYKLPFGHRGHNQPCMELDTKRCFMTSQNHGYAIDATSLPKEWEISFKNLNDGSVEGISHRKKPFYAVQFHPEASPGPTDTQWMFNRFYNLL